MRQKYTKQEIAEILELAETNPIKDIVKMTGYTDAQIRCLLYRERKKLRNTTKQEEETKPAVRELSPREMIKALYEMGYRIENNQLVCYQKHIVKINDIIQDA